MKSSRLSLLLVLLLFLTLPAKLPASPASSPGHTGPVFAEWLENVNFGRPTDRTTVVRIAALAMALGLFIMYYKKH